MEDTQFYIRERS